MRTFFALLIFSIFSLDVALGGPATPLASNQAKNQARDQVGEQVKDRSRDQAVCRYMELRAPSRPGDSTQRELPIYLAFPDSLGPVKVQQFLEAPKKQAREILQGSNWLAKPLSSNEKRFLAALRDFIDGRMQEAGTEIGLLSRSGNAKLLPFLRIDKGLLLLLAGFPEDAEREWQRGLQGKNGHGVCAEVAWRNLYSLYLGEGDFKNAHGLVDEALKVEPKNKWAIFAKGYLLRMLAPGEEWENFLREKSSWRDSLFEIQIAYGKFLKDQGKLSEAAKYYSRGLEGAPKNGPAWLDLADIYYRLEYYIFAQTCIRKSIRYGIADPYLFELYSLVLQSYHGSGARGAETWRIAQGLLEEGFPHDLHSRSMAQLLYHVYCHNGKVEAAQNLRQTFWFHFEGPGRSKPRPLQGPGATTRGYLKIGFSEISFPLVLAMKGVDFYEPF